MQTQNSQITQINTAQEPRTAVEIQNWLVSYLAELLVIEANKINLTIPFDRYGIDSSTAIGLTGDLEKWLGINLDPTLVYDYPSVEAFAHHVAEQVKAKHSN